MNINKIYLGLPSPHIVEEIKRRNCLKVVGTDGTVSYVNYADLNTKSLAYVNASGVVQPPFNRIPSVNEASKLAEVDDCLGNITNFSATAFYNCTNLRKVRFPCATQTGMRNLFQNCRNLKEVYMPRCLAICANCFFNCSGLETISFQKFYNKWAQGVSMQGNAFAYCSSLKSIKSDRYMVFNNANAFIGCTSFKLLDLSGSDVEISQLNNVNAFTGVSTPLTVRVISSHAQQMRNNANWKTVIDNGTVVLEEV